MNAVATQPHVTLSGGITGEYVVEDQRPDGRLSLVPSYPQAKPAFDGRPATPEEFEAFLAEYGPHMLPPDGEE
jgi:hypothetical protein